MPPERREQRPLLGIRTVVTRPRVQAAELGEALEGLGANVLYFSTIRIEKIYGALAPYLPELHRYDWILFTSRNAVSLFLEEAHAAAVDLRALPRLRVGAIGRATAQELERCGVPVHLVPHRSAGDSMAEAMARAGPLKEWRILLPRAASAGEVLPKELRREGADVVDVPLYRTVTDEDHPEEIVARLRRGEADLLVFASPSAVNGFKKLIGEAVFGMPHLAVAAIGPVTAGAVRRHGGEPEIVPERFDTQSLIDAVVQWAERRRQEI